MSKFKRINREDLTLKETQLFKSQSFTNTSIETYMFQKDNEAKNSGLEYIYKSKENRNTEQIVTRHSLWSSLNTLFYLSGSSYNDTESKYSNPHYTLAEWTCYSPPPKDLNNLHLHKFHSASKLSHHKGIVYNIPQKYFGEHIKPGTFKLEETGSLTLRDDAFGNLYAVVDNIGYHPDPYTPASSSQNYVGNIFYRNGIVVVNEQQFGTYGSPSASLDRMGINFTCSFNQANTIYTSEYNLKINPGEFNISTNPTVYADSSNTGSGHIYGPLTASGEFCPYFNQVYLYNEDETEPVMIASLSQPIQRNHQVPLKLKIKLDW